MRKKILLLRNPQSVKGRDFKFIKVVMTGYFYCKSPAIISQGVMTLKNNLKKKLRYLPINFGDGARKKTIS